MFPLFAALGAAIPSASMAGTYPDHPIRLVVPFSPGSNNDVIARIVANRMADILKQPIVVEDRPGAGGLPGANNVLHADPDGYSILFANTTTMSILPSLNSPPPYDPVKAFAPISTIGVTPLILVVSAKSGIVTLDQLIEKLKKDDKSNYGTSGFGTPMHLVGASFSIMKNVKATAIPYHGSPEIITALLSGDVNFAFDGPTNVPFIKEKKMVGLAVTGRQRMKDLPDVPTMTELGYTNFEYMISWYGLVAPADTPKDVIAILNAAIVEAMKAPEVKGKLEEFGAQTFAGTPEEMLTFMGKEAEIWGGIIHTANVRP